MDVLVRDYNVDPDQIFVSGHSNGAIMTMRVACELGYRVRGAVPYLGSMVMKDAKGKGEGYKLTSPESGIDMTMYSYDKISKQEWLNSPSFYECPQSNTDWLIVNGNDDKMVTVGGGIYESA